ncbi:MAG: hypothetical protein ACNYPI_06395 [Arenicellales bacterium WSBS_2016_MAG_OTU3]
MNLLPGVKQILIYGLIALSITITLGIQSVTNKMPAKIAAQVVSVLEDQGIIEGRVEVQDREVVLFGKIDYRLPRAAIVAQLRDIKGIDYVTDNMVATHLGPSVLSMSSFAGKLQIQGRLPVGINGDRLQQKLGDTFGADNITNTLVFSEQVAPIDWVNKLDTLIEIISLVDLGTIELREAHGEVSGVTISNADKDRVGALIVQLGDSVSVENRVRSLNR